MTVVQEISAPSSMHNPVPSGFRSLVVQVEPGEEASARLDVAVSLARKLDAFLLGVGVEMLQSSGVADPFGMLEAQWLGEMRKILQENLDRAEAVFRAKTSGLNAEWVQLTDMPARAIARFARRADLIVAGGAPIKAADTYKSADPAELMLQSGRPVLVAPPAGGPFTGEGIVVAWKDTREARRALADSLPFLKAAKDVVVLEVCAEDEFADAELHTFSVVEHLRRHGIDARAKATIAPPERVSHEIDYTARAVGADLVVAGGYGHTRLGEWAFGGVTRDLLRTPERFVLLSH